MKAYLTATSRDAIIKKSTLVIEATIQWHYVVTAFIFRLVSCAKSHQSYA